MFPPILAKLTTLVQKRRRAERRQARRLSLGQSVCCQLRFPGDSRERAARVDNLSVRGIGILTSEATSPRTTLQIVLINAPHTFSLTAEVEVVRCCGVVNGDYFLGCKFTRPLTYDEMAPFLV
jgi:hypothetical protein